MRQTTNYNLQKPDYNNVADIEVLNGNFDILDSELKKKAGEAEVKDAIRQLDNLLDRKVDKVPGKGLSSNDYTTPEKGKLGALPTKSQLDILLDGKVDKVPGMGLSKNSFSDAEKEKLAGLYNTQIVDNLTDGGRDKALSADQGKVLFRTVVDGKHAVATAINDVAKKSVANKYMTHQQLAEKIKEYCVGYDWFKYMTLTPPDSRNTETIMSKNLNDGWRRNQRERETVTRQLEAGIYYISLVFNKTEHNNSYHKFQVRSSLPPGSQLLVLKYEERDGAPSKKFRCQYILFLPAPAMVTFYFECGFSIDGYSGSTTNRFFYSVSKDRLQPWDNYRWIGNFVELTGGYYG